MSVIVSCEWLNERLNDKKGKVSIIDVRFQLKDALAGKAAYDRNHLPGAIYLDLNEELSNPRGEHGGNHPLPDMKGFVRALGNKGINNDSIIIIYGGDSDMFSARLWWMLDYIGHEDVHILDGGYDKWVKSGYQVTRDITQYEQETYIPNIKGNQTVDVEYIRENIKTRDAILIDSRGHSRYLGENEPLYKKAGHIPGAVNFVWSDVLNEDGSWKNEAALQEHFSSLKRDREIIVSCGSGVSACPNILGLKKAGFKNVKLYPGSFSDWISYDEHDVETSENFVK